MAKVQIKETMRKNVNCTLNLSGENVLLEVEGFDEPLDFREVFSRFNMEEVRISVDLKIDHKPEE